MSKKDNISSFQIAHSKIWADGEKYFSLFEKHIPELEAGHKVLVYDISNLEFICKLMSLNKDAEFWIYGNQEVNEALRVLGFSFHEVAEDLESKTYNIPDMKFDCIIRNPPYERNLHLKILAEAIKHLKDKKSTCVNLSPVLKLQTAWRRGKVAKELSFLNSCTASVDVIDCDTAVALFNLGNCGTDLGIWKCALKNSTNIFELGKSITSNAAFIDKIKRITSNMPKMNEHLIDAMSVKNNSLFIKFVDGLSLKNNGGHGKSSYAATSINFSTATKFTPGHHCKYVLFTDKNEQFVFWKIYTSNVIRFFYMTLMGGNTEYELLPWLGDSINPRTGKKGYEGEWTDEDLYKFFNITPEEQKSIEETMEKYK